MENWDCHRMDSNSQNGEYLHHNHHHGSRNQSFSSALLAAIYKSTEDEGEMMAENRRRSRIETRNVLKGENNRVTTNSRIERQWQEDPWTHNEKFMRGRSVKIGVFNAEKDEAEAEIYSKHREFHPSFQSNMSYAALSSSDYTSDSTSSCPYLSSDAESLYRHTSSIPTAKIERNFHHVGREDKACKWAIGSRNLLGKSSVRDGHFRSTEKPFVHADHHSKIKSNSKVRKDSKKPKQPISPGRKLANFLNSLFMPAGTKKSKLSSSSSVSDSNSYDFSERKTASVYSSPSSVQSRPCLRKSSRGSSNSRGMSQKSVTFYPSVIVDEDSRPCGNQSLHGRKKYPKITHPVISPYPQIAHPSSNNLPLFGDGLKQHILEEKRHAPAAAKEIIARYQKANSMMETMAIRGIAKPDEDEVEEDDDDASCSSSELFELENLEAIDMDMNVYQTELPVYGTTHFVINKSIGKELIW